MATPVTYNPDVALDPYAVSNRIGRVTTPPLNNTGAAISQFGSSLDQLGGALQGAANRAEAVQNQRAVADTQVQLATFHEGQQKALQDAEETGADPTNFAPAFMDNYDSASARFLDGVDNSAAKQYAKVHLANLGVQMHGNALVVQAKARTEKTVNDTQAFSESLGRIAGNDETQYQASLQQLRTYADLAVPAPLRPHLLPKAEEALSAATTAGYVARNPFAALKDLNKAAGIVEAPPIAPQSVPLPAGWTQENLRNAALSAQASGLTEFQLNMNGSEPAMGTGPFRPVNVADVLSPPTPAKGDAQTFPYLVNATDQKPTKSGVPFIDSLPFAKILEFRNHAESLVGQVNSGARAAIASVLQDAESMAKKAQLHPAMPTPDRVLRAFGPVDGPLVVARFQQVQTMATDAAGFKTLPGPQIVALLNERAPVTPQGFASAQHYQDELQKLAAATLKQREDDAPAYVLSSSPQVSAAQQAATAANGNPNISDADRQAANNAYITQSLAEQDRLGIRSRAILRRDQVQNIVDSVSNHTGSGDNTAQVIRTLEGRYGKTWWPQVYKEVATGFAKDRLPDSFLLVPAIVSPGGREYVSRLDGVDLAKQKAALSSGMEKDLHDRVVKGLAPWSESMFGNETNQRAYTAAYTVAMKIAIDRSTKGMGADDAASAGVKTLIGQYEFPNSGSTLRYAVPIVEDPNQVSGGAQQAIGRSYLWKLKAPPDLTDKRTPEERDREWQSMVSERPLWATNGDETGLKLYTTDKGGRPQAVQWPSGKQVEFTWADLRGFWQGAQFDAHGLPQVPGNAQRGTPTTTYSDSPRTLLEREHKAKAAQAARGN